MTILEELSAFTTSPTGGNPAGVWIGPLLPRPREMLRLAGELGHSETAFLAPDTGDVRTVRYYSPEAEVSFCGHATIAAGVLLGRLHGEGLYRLETREGVVPVEVRRTHDHWEASLTSVEPRHEAAPQGLVTGVLEALDWSPEELDPAVPPAIAYGGANHLVLAARSKDRLDRLDYDFEALKARMLDADLTTVQLIWRESPAVIHARNPFPVGGVVEDPATGAAAAALGGYLRDAGLIEAPTEFQIRQGETMGRPSRLTVTVPSGGGVIVSGTAVVLNRRTGEP